LIQLRLYRFAGAGELREEKRVPCPVCRGDFKRCRLEICPYLKDVRELLRRVQRSRVIFGSSPPSIFVGSWGYPKVLMGPLVPPVQADTSLLERYDEWLDIPLRKLVAMRLGLVRGKKPVRVVDARRPARILETFQELAMAYAPADVEMELEKEPRIVPSFRLRSAIMGPSGDLVKASLAENPAIPRAVEKAVSDMDLRASEAIYKLYRSGLNDRYIVRLLSAGLLGVKRWRRIVPTEWSITAVDDQLGKWLREKVLDSSWLSEYRIYSHQAHYNRVTILMMPGPWSFEVLEAWYRAGRMSLYRDSELPMDVERYPEEVGGAYHALRLPVLEKLYHERRQATTLTIAEVYEGWIPLGVWRFREICRRALSSEPRTYSELDEALTDLMKLVDLPREILEKGSRVLRYHREQRLITAFINT